MTHPLPFTWPYAAIFWAAFLWAFAPEFGLVDRAQRAQGKADSNSLQVIMGMQGLSTFVAFSIAWWPRMLMPIVPRLIAFVIGILMILFGSLVRRHCFRMLGASFTGDVRAHADQQVVSAGAYRFVRHPSYTAGIMTAAGLGVALGSWWSALVAVVFPSAAYVYRMNVEERVLLSEIGEPYRVFASTRKRLVPFIY